MNAITTASIARAILKESDKPASPRHHRVIPCFTCGHDFDWNRTSSRFCSDRCKEFYDKTSQRYEKYSAVDMLRRFPVSAKIINQGNKGAGVECPGCGKRFESVGLAYCSKQCSAEAKTRKPAMMPIMPGKRRDTRHANAAAKQAAYRSRKRNENAFLAASTQNEKTLRITAKKSR